MKGKLHLLAGFTIGISEAALLMYTKGALEAAAFAGFAIAGSILPDSDLPNTKMGINLPYLANILNKTFGHRGFIHTPVCALMLSGALFFAVDRLLNADIAWLCATGLFTGYMIHLFQDMFTKGGISFFYPISRSRISFTKIKSNSKIHNFITFAILGIWFYLIIPFQYVIERSNFF